MTFRSFFFIQYDIRERCTADSPVLLKVRMNIMERVKTGGW
jgi:hypothetical protein